MDYVTINYVAKKPKLKNPILIEGLPGIGNVGKLAVEHLIENIGAVKFAELYSKDFPPQVFINIDGTIELVKNEFYYWKGKKKNQRDLVLLTGDYQGLSSQGQYELVEKILDIAEEFGVKELFTLGGYGLGHDIGEPKVLCATTGKNLVKTILFAVAGTNFNERLSRSVSRVIILSNSDTPVVDIIAVLAMWTRV